MAEGGTLPILGVAGEPARWGFFALVVAAVVVYGVRTRYPTAEILAFVRRSRATLIGVRGDPRWFLRRRVVALALLEVAFVAVLCVLARRLSGTAVAEPALGGLFLTVSAVIAAASATVIDEMRIAVSPERQMASTVRFQDVSIKADDVPVTFIERFYTGVTKRYRPWLLAATIFGAVVSFGGSISTASKAIRAFVVGLWHLITR